MLQHDRHRRKALLASILAAGGIALAGCGGVGPKAVIREGDGNTVEIKYAENLAQTEPLARGYCLRYEKAPVFVSADGEIAVYNCVPLPPLPKSPPR